MVLGGNFLARAPDLLYPTCPGWGFLSSASTIMSYIMHPLVARLVLLLLLFLSLALVLYIYRCRHSSVLPEIQRTTFDWRLKYKNMLVDFAVEDIVGRNMQHSDVIGVGGSGKVRRIRLQHRTVAVKELERMLNPWAQVIIDKLFDAEVNALGRIRHRNIITLLCSITGSSTNLLVYEYMENGSLDTWLHKPRGRLDWPSRVGIAIDAARGLNYMHDQAIIHRDIKSSNILLDYDFGAKIGDFGLARLLAKPGESEQASVVCGTPGHIAPECLRNAEVSETVDVYSFGVVLLELTTGRKPHNAATEPGTSLARWASQEFKKNKVVWEDIIDEDIQNQDFLGDMKAVFKLGLSCTSENPLDRPSMYEVLLELLRYDRSRVKRRAKKRTTESFGAKVLRNIRDKIFRGG